MKWNIGTVFRGLNGRGHAELSGDTGIEVVLVSIGNTSYNDVFPIETNNKIKWNFINVFFPEIITWERSAMS